MTCSIFVSSTTVLNIRGWRGIMNAEGNRYRSPTKGTNYQCCVLYTTHSKFNLAVEAALNVEVIQLLSMRTQCASLGKSSLHAHEAIIQPRGCSLPPKRICAVLICQLCRFVKGLKSQSQYLKCNKYWIHIKNGQLTRCNNEA